jgi:hypothetical protein
VLVLVEHGDPLRFLPEGSEPCPPGFNERLVALEQEWLTAMRADLPGSTASAGYPAMLEAAGFTVSVDRVVRVRLAAPLADAPRQMLLSRLRRMQELFAERLDATDRGALGVLVDEGDPQGVMRRDDVFLDASRHVYVATAAT